MSKQEVGRFNQYLSMIDLSKHPRFLEYAKEWDENILLQMMYDLGADIKNNGYEMQMQTHRPRTCNKVVHCQRFVFTERTDRKWIDTGMMTEDIVRNHPSAIVRVGMRLAMNEARNTEEQIKSRMTKDELKGDK